MLTRCLCLNPILGLCELDFKLDFKANQLNCHFCSSIQKEHSSFILFPFCFCSQQLNLASKNSCYEQTFCTSHWSSILLKVSLHMMTRPQVQNVVLSWLTVSCLASEAVHQQQKTVMQYNINCV